VKRTWSEDELRDQWSLSPEEQALLTRKTSRGQLGFVVLLKYFQLETRFPRDRQDQSASQHHLHQCGVNSTVFGTHQLDQPPELHRA
jgi:hypothetical protein